MERFGGEKKKILNSMFLIVFGILFYLMVGQEENLHWIFKIFQPIILAFSIAYVMEPVVKVLCNRFKLKRGISVLIILLALIGLIVISISFIIPTLVRSIKDLVNLISIEQLNNIVNEIVAAIGMDQSSEVFKQLSNMLGSFVNKFGETITILLQNSLGAALQVTSGIFNLIVSLCIAIYMLLDKDDLLARIKRLMYAFNKKESVDEALSVGKRANEIFIRFFIGKIIDSVIIGIICFVVMFICKIPYSPLLSIIIGITNMIPYFGPFIGGVPAVLIVLFVSPMKALVAGIIIIILQQFDGLYLGPKILGDKVGVGAFWIIVSVTVGGAIMGVWGMLLGVPITVLFKTLIEESVQRKLDEKGLGDIEKDKLKEA
ncbi:AI-2E family transporter [Oceanirhabdus sp. W0125-5]|uniref:AI-2E family transporter n=1 Tax=Oceanirhabdus sp. W0125-5 TaxID=2999116 RepID=UPI0022F32EA4|nr:AI-2E family transporter [Oceanirhabdus sp. W0125-5]WBW97859.1 AI-2E family transporter [Oceanirhabdus sp. W0125-5]